MSRSDTDTSRAGRHRFHKVGATSAGFGMLAIALLSFATVSRSRIATGEPLSSLEALGPLGLAALMAPWILVLLFSAGDRKGGLFALGRGAGAAAVIVALAWSSGMAAVDAVAEVGQFARYSLGGGVWAAGFAALALLLASRRELGTASVAGWAVVLAAPIGLGLLGVAGVYDSLGIAAEYRNVSARFSGAVAQHIWFAAASIGIATVLGVAIGVAAHRNRRVAGPLFALVGSVQTIPGLALVGMLVVPLATLADAYPVLRTVGIGGLGWSPLVIALTLYALLAVVRNTYAGLESVPEHVTDAGRGMGMTGGQLMRRVQMPLARPIVFSGIRTASQQTVGNATLGAFVAAGGLGPFIFLGLAQQANDLVVLGSITLVTLALTVDVVMRGVQRLLDPRQRRKGSR